MVYYNFLSKCTHRQLILTGITGLAICVFLLQALVTSKWLIAIPRLSLSDMCILNVRHYAAKPFFNFLCQSNVSFLKDSIRSDKHICEQLFPSHEKPSLFSRLHDEFKPFKTQKITQNDIENMSLSCRTCHHIQIIGNELYNVPRPAARVMQTRSRSVKMLLKYVIDTFSGIPDLDLFFTIDDAVDLGAELNGALFNVPIFAIAKSKKISWGLRPDRIVLMPCFTLWSWPEARAGRWPRKFESIITASQQFEYEKRVPKLFWRGFEFPKRSWFIKVANQHLDNMDVQVNWFTKTNDSLAFTPTDKFKSLEDHCNYKYLLHLEGHTYSSRVKYLLLCGSTVVFNVIEQWEEYWYHLLEHGKNVIFFEQNGNETALNSTLQFLTKHQDEVRSIGRRGQEIAQRYLNEHAVSCYWWKLLHEYGQLLGYTPRLHPDAVHIDDLILGDAP